MLHRNLPLKAAAFGLAVFLWFWVLLNERTPIVEMPVRVGITTEGVRDDLALRGPLPAAEVRVRGLKRDLDGNIGEWVDAFVGCRNCGPGQHRLPVQVRVPERISIVSVKPAQVFVVLEPVISESKPVDLTLTGELPAGSELMGTEVSPQIVQVSGARSQVEGVAQVEALMDLGRAVADVPVSLPVRAVDSAGAEVKGLTLNPPRVNVRVTTKSLVSSRTVPVLVRTGGALPTNLRIASVRVEPPMVTVVGPATLTAQADYVATVDLSLTGARQSFTRKLALVVPEGLNVLGDPHVTVTVAVEREMPVAGQPEESSEEAPDLR
jgi:YbbR domain-containing protein